MLLALRKTLILYIIYVFATPGAHPQAESPEVHNNGASTVLFEIWRNRDADKIYYELALNRDGNLNQQEPISIYWKQHSKNGEIKPLTRIQRNHSYGLKYLEIKPDHARFRFAASKERDFILMKNPQGQFRVYTLGEKGYQEFIRMYIHFSGGSYLMPVIGHIELTLKDQETGLITTQAFEP